MIGFFLVSWYRAWCFFLCVCVVYFFVGVVFWCFGVLAPVADRRARARDAIATPRGASARRVIHTSRAVSRE